MNLLGISVFRLLRYSLYINIKQTNQQYCNVAHNELKSAIFTDYKIIYTFPYIQYPYILNKVKRNITIGTGSVYPIISYLGMSTDECLTVLAFYCLTTALLHVNCCLINNLIATIYFKEDTQEVIISYINYWGKRINLNKNVNTIIPLSKHSIKLFPSIYKFLQFKDYDKKLKLYVKMGKINEKSDFYKLFGTVN